VSDCTEMAQNPVARSPIAQGTLTFFTNARSSALPSFQRDVTAPVSNATPAHGSNPQTPFFARTQSMPIGDTPQSAKAASVLSSGEAKDRSACVSCRKHQTKVCQPRLTRPDLTSDRSVTIRRSVSEINAREACYKSGSLASAASSARRIASTSAFACRAYFPCYNLEI
jgi:hypothetical protein